MVERKGVNGELAPFVSLTTAGNQGRKEKNHFETDDCQARSESNAPGLVVSSSVQQPVNKPLQVMVSLNIPRPNEEGDLESITLSPDSDATLITVPSRVQSEKSTKPTNLLEKLETNEANKLSYVDIQFGSTYESET